MRRRRKRAPSSWRKRNPAVAPQASATSRGSVPGMATTARAIMTRPPQSTTLPDSCGAMPWENVSEDDRCSPPFLKLASDTAPEAQKQPASFKLGLGAAH